MSTPNIYNVNLDLLEINLSLATASLFDIMPADSTALQSRMSEDSATVLTGMVQIHKERNVNKIPAQQIAIYDIEKGESAKQVGYGIIPLTMAHYHPNTTIENFNWQAYASFSGVSGTAARDQDIAYELSLQAKRIWWAREVMLAEFMEFGTITVKDLQATNQQTSILVNDFKRSSTLKIPYSASIDFSISTVDPMSFSTNTLPLVMSQANAGGVKQIVLGLLAWKAFIANPNVQNYFKFYKATNESVNFDVRLIDDVVAGEFIIGTFAGIEWRVSYDTVQLPASDGTLSYKYVLNPRKMFWWNGVKGLCVFGANLTRDMLGMKVAQTVEIPTSQKGVVVHSFSTLIQDHYGNSCGTAQVVPDSYSQIQEDHPNSNLAKKFTYEENSITSDGFVHSKDQIERALKEIEFEARKVAGNV